MSRSKNCQRAAQIAAIAGASLLSIAAISKKRKRSCWIKPWMTRRDEKGSFSFVRSELLLEDEHSFRNYLRMDENVYRILLGHVEQALIKQDTKMRKAISPSEKLSATLRFLATGESYQSLEYQTRLSKSFLCYAIPEVCDVIYAKLKDEYLKFPETPGTWANIAENFAIRWQFPLCMGALDGKHINFRCLREDGALYHNYKGTDSIVLLALVDSDYKFLYINVGCNGRISDGGVLRRSTLANVIENAEQNFPQSKTIGNNRKLPYVIVADDAFPLQEHIMKPYPYHSAQKSKRIFNYRLSRARRCVEHAFGILANRFRILLTTIDLDVSNVNKIVLALHNFLLQQNTHYSEIESNSSVLPEAEVQHMPNRYSSVAGTIRDSFTNYFCNEGKVNWQDQMI